MALVLDSSCEATAGSSKYDQGSEEPLNKEEVYNAMITKIWDCDTSAVPSELNATFQDWEYAWVEDYSRVAPGLFIGPFRSTLPGQEAYLREDNIGSILVVSHPLEAAVTTPIQVEGVKHVRLELEFPTLKENVKSDSMLDLMHQAVDHISEVTSSEDKAVLIVSLVGDERAPLLAGAYLISHYNLSPLLAMRVMAANRRRITLSAELLELLTRFHDASHVAVKPQSQTTGDQVGQSLTSVHCSQSGVKSDVKNDSSEK